MGSNRNLCAALVAALSLMSCSTSSESFVADADGYSVIRGRITRVEGLHAHQVQPLSDGVALTLAEPGCTVSLRLDNDETRQLEAAPGTILVHGYASDFVLRWEPGTRGPAAPSR